MVVRFGSTHDQFAAKKLFVVQFLHSTFGFIDRQHLHESEAFRTLVMFVGYYLCVLHRADAVEEFEKIALRCVERQIPDVKPGRRDFNRLRSARGARRVGTVLTGRLRNRSDG